MTETRENLSFESKAQLLKEFWDKRNRIKNLEQKEVEIEELKQDLLNRVSDLETKAELLLNRELSPTELNQELNNLKLLFKNANLPNTYSLLSGTCQQLLAISQLFDTENLSSGSPPPSRPSSRPPSPTGEDDEKVEKLKEKIRFEAQKAQNYLDQISELTAEIDDKDLEIEELKETIRQLKGESHESSRVPSPFPYNSDSESEEEEDNTDKTD